MGTKLSDLKAAINMEQTVVFEGSLLVAQGGIRNHWGFVGGTMGFFGPD